MTQQIIPNVSTDEQSQFKQNLAIQALHRSAVASREVLTANRTYYVRTDGSNGNDGLTNTADGAFLTLQGAWDTIKSAIDVAGYTVTIQIGDGTYSGQLALSGWIGGGQITVQGNASDNDAVVLSHASAIRGGRYEGLVIVRYVKFTGTTVNIDLVFGPALLVFSNVNFAGAASYHVRANSTGTLIAFNGDYEISAGAGAHFATASGGAIQAFAAVTITVTGTPAFSVAFAFAEAVSSILVPLITFSGSATGARYLARLNAVISSDGAGASYFPGDAGGSTATGGQYA